MWVSGFILFGTLCASWIWVCFLHQVREVFSHYFFKYVFYLFFPPSLSFPSGIPIMLMLVCLMLSPKSLRLSSFLGITFSFCCSNWVISTTLYSRFLVCPSTSSNLLLIPLVYFSFQLLYSSVLISSFLYFVSFIYLFILINLFILFYFFGCIESSLLHTGFP